MNMNTNADMNMPSQNYDARKALGGYLERTDLLLARSGLSRSERDETLGQIAEQFYDLLGVPIEEADRELTENAIAQLAPETAFELNDAMTLRQHLRATWHRLMIGRLVPLFLNDHGRKRVVWGELIPRMLWMGLFMALVFTITNMLMLGRPSWRWGINGAFFCFMYTGTGFGVYRMYHRMPVETMPRAEDWSAVRQHQRRYGWLLYAGGSFLFVLALFPAGYWLVATILNKPAWPVEQGLFFTVSMALNVPLFLLFMWNALQRRNTRRFCNWDRQANR